MIHLFVYIHGYYDFDFKNKKIIIIFTINNNDLKYLNYVHELIRNIFNANDGAGKENNC